MRHPCKKGPKSVGKSLRVPGEPNPEAQTAGGLCACIGGCVHACMREWVHAWVGACIGGWVRVCVHGQVGEKVGRATKEGAGAWCRVSEPGDITR